jgi:hypothetical protein
MKTNNAKLLLFLLAQLVALRAAFAADTELPTTVHVPTCRKCENATQGESTLPCDLTGPKYGHETAFSGRGR